MKKTVLTILALSLTAAAWAGPLRVVTGVVSRLDSLSVGVSFTVRVPAVGSTQMLTLTPELAGDSLRRTLRPVLVMGRAKRLSRIRSYRGEGPLMGRRPGFGFTDLPTRGRKCGGVRVALADPAGAAVLPGDPQVNSVLLAGAGGAASPDSLQIDYRIELPYGEWMEGMTLRAVTQMERCGHPGSPLSWTLREDCLRPFVPVYDTLILQPVLPGIRELDVRAPYLYPTEEYERVMKNFDRLTPNDAVVVLFEQSRTTLDTAYRDNAAALAQIVEVLRMVEADSCAALSHIVLAGKASPDGRRAYNERLSVGRAEALQEYLRPYAFSGSFDLLNGGEDWVGLRRMIAESDIKDRQEVLDMIDRYADDADLCEEKLRFHNLGHTYKYLARNIFPELRNAGYVLLFYDYRTPEIAEARIAELIDGHHYTQALEALAGVSRNAQTDNLRGICHMMLYDYDQAELFFRRAVSHGSAQAAENLRQLEDNRNYRRDPARSGR